MQAEKLGLKPRGGTAWSHGFLNQKDWHPLSYRNQEKLFKAEQEAEQGGEKKKPRRGVVSGVPVVEGTQGPKTAYGVDPAMRVITSPDLTSRAVRMTDEQKRLVNISDKNLTKAYDEAFKEAQVRVADRADVRTTVEICRCVCVRRW